MRGMGMVPVGARSRHYLGLLASAASLCDFCCLFQVFSFVSFLCYFSASSCFLRTMYFTAQLCFVAGLCLLRTSLHNPKISIQKDVGWDGVSGTLSASLRSLQLEVI